VRDKPKVLVTGATGFVGSHLVEELLARGYSVRVLIRRTSNLRWVPEQTERVLGDVRDPESLRLACRGVQWVFHFGALVKAARAQEFFEANSRGTENLFNAFLDAGVSPGMFFFCSSLSAVGPGEEGRPLQEDDKPRPVSTYGRSKLAAERFLLSHAHGSEDPRILILRPPAVYGPRDESVRRLARFIRRGWMPLPVPKGARVSVVYVKDVVQGTLLLAEKGCQGVFHVSDGWAYTWEDLGGTLARIMQRRVRPLRIPLWLSLGAATVSELLGRLRGGPPLLSREKVREIHQHSWVCSVEKIRREAGYVPQWNAERGFRETLAWYSASGWL
jgi:nucleoside-diphosphate-sugar epimerase